MKYLFPVLIFLLLTGCPKKQEISTVEKERKENINKLIYEEEDFFDDLPESREDTGID